MITVTTAIGEVLPAETIQRLAAFLASGGTGKTVFNWQNGAVMQEEFTTTVHHKRVASPLTGVVCK